MPTVGAAATLPAGCGLSVDLVMVLDDSGSMHRDDDERNDPDNLRITAAHLMLDLLDPDDRVGLVLFSDTLREQAPLQALSTARTQLHRRVDQFRSQGGTGLDQAMQAAMAQLAAEPAQGRPRAILLLTDGRPEPDPAGQRTRLLALARQAREQQVAIYVIGLGPSYDRGLLEEITLLSGSEQLWPVTRPEHLSGAFLEILRLLKGLNIETSTAGEVPLLGLSGEVKFAAIRSSGDPPARMTWAGGRLVSTVTAQGLSPEVRYSYDLLAYEPVRPEPATAKTTAPVVWKIERPPVSARTLAPGAREEVAAGEETEVRLQLTPCSGNSLPAGLRASLTVLDGDRKPTPYTAELRPSPGDPSVLTGVLRMPPDAGTYVLSSRILTAEGRQAAVAEQTVTAVPQHRWVLEAPAALANGATGAVTVRHRFGGKPAPADPGSLTAIFPDGTERSLDLTPGPAGEWTASVTAPADQTGQLTIRLSDGRGTARTQVEPVRFIPDPPPAPVRWSFWQARRGEARPVTLTGRTTGPIDHPGVIPPYTGGAQRWTPAADKPGSYTAEAAIPAPGKPGWFTGRELTTTLQPEPGPYLQAEPVTVTTRLAPLLPWYWLIALLAALIIAGYAIWFRLYDGPQLPIAIGVAGGAPILLMGRRPGVFTRFLNPQTQREITVGGLESGARVRMAELPPKALLRVKSRGVSGRERFRLESLNPQLPLVQHGLNKRRVSLKGRGPVPGIGIGDILLDVHLHPKNRTRR